MNYGGAPRPHYLACHAFPSDEPRCFDMLVLPIATGSTDDGKHSAGQGPLACAGAAQGLLSLPKTFPTKVRRRLGRAHHRGRHHPRRSTSARSGGSSAALHGGRPHPGTTAACAMCSARCWTPAPSTTTCAAWRTTWGRWTPRACGRKTWSATPRCARIRRRAVHGQHGDVQIWEPLLR